MERAEQQSVHKCLQDFQKLPLWIIEYIWNHKKEDIPEVVEHSTWSEMDFQPLSLDDTCRLRVASARAYSIMKNRDVEHFDRLMGFLESTYRLLPQLVSPIKHMKIMFGLKTMVVMQMLWEGRGMVETVFKINQFFPSKLPQYQGQCSQHEMFLMRKNHLDFKALAQALAMNKNKLEDYIMDQMEEQYGEHYAQKVEDRLLHYLHQLETVLPRDTHVDKILKKESPVTEEEKQLLEVIKSDSMTIAATLKKLLHCEAASCGLDRFSKSPEPRNTRMQSGQSSESNTLFKSVEVKTQREFEQEIFRGGEEAEQDVSKDSPLLLENDNGSDMRRQHKEVVQGVEKESSGENEEDFSQRSSECASSPQFCSKHQRWVKSILQQCPDECSEELQHEANASFSPLLFQSSSSGTSSQDLTPSDLISCPPDQQNPSPQTFTNLQTVSQTCGQANLEDKLGGSATSQRGTLPQPPSFTDTLLPALFSPVVRLIDISSMREIHLPFKNHRGSLNLSTMADNKHGAPSSQVLTSPHPHTLENNAIVQGTAKGNTSTFDHTETVIPTNLPNTTHKVQTDPVIQDASNSTSRQTQSFRRLSGKFRQACSSRQSKTLDGFSRNHIAEQIKTPPTTFGASFSPIPDDFNVFEPPSTSVSQSSIVSSVCTANQITLSSEVVPQSTAARISSTTSLNCVAARSETSQAQMTLSLPSQALLLQSKLLQPYVSLRRLSAQDCYQVTKGRSSTMYVEPVVQGSNDKTDGHRLEEEEEEADSSFDLNILYSSYSTSSDGEDSIDSDPDYKPSITKKRLTEYEAAIHL